MAGSRRQYPFHLIEPKWQQTWEQQQAFRAFNPGDSVPEGHPFGVRHGLSGKVAATQLPPKFYILDMFPYPSGAGLHVGHPEGYTATDILARYRRACGFNVLHPMGWDSFGLPAEQYAVKTGQHPRVTTEANIANFTRQIKSLGFSYDWTRELATTDVEYFKWTQWIFLKLYNSWFNPDTKKAEPIDTLKYPAGLRLPFSTSDKTELETLESNRRIFRDSKRLAYVSEAPVNWCPELGTVLANEEVIDGKSEVGGFPVIRKPMRQWMLRITAYAEKLLADLDTIDWTDSLKEMQRNWIGRSEGAYIKFNLEGCVAQLEKAKEKAPESDQNIINWDAIEADIRSMENQKSDSIWVFTTRPDTLFGATYMVLSPEHKLVPQLTTPEQKKAIEDYQAFAAGRSDLERTELAKEKSGVFTGAYVLNPVNGERIPIWIADYVLASYGTGAIMAVPAHDDRDFEFAKKFDLKIKTVIEPCDRDGLAWKRHQQRALKGAVIPNQEIWVTSDLFDKNGKGVYQWDERKAFTYDGNACQCVNSANAELSLNGLPFIEAKEKIIAWLEAKGLGKKTINYKLRDWLFSRQRYWGEPFPIVWKKDATGNLYHEALPESALPVLLPDLSNYKPIPTVREQTPHASEVTKCQVEQYLSASVIEMLKAAPRNETCRALVMSSVGRMPDASLDTYEKIKEWIEVTFNPPAGAGEPPLARAKDWVEKVPEAPGATRETNTMPQWAGSCWYYLRYLDAKNAGAFVGKDAESYWMGGSEVRSQKSEVGNLTSGLRPPASGVDLYVGGTEHAVLHLLYARFWHKVLFDLGYVSTPEPFFKLVNQGLILGEDGQKMSKSRGNVVNPDDVLKEFGADAFRLYEMFMGPLQDTKPWNTRGVEGVYRFLGRVWRLFVDENSETAFEQAETTTDAQKHGELLDLILLDGAITDSAATPAQLKTLHACIKKVTEDLDGMRFNTAISAMMVFINEANTWQTKPLPVMKTFLQLLAPFAPHLAEELWARLHSTFGLRPSSLAYEPWPKFDAALLVESEIEIPVSVNGKMRDVIKVAADADNATIEAAALSSEKVKQFIAGKPIKKIIIVPKKMVNIVVG